MDKIEKVKKKIEKLKSQLLRGACSSQVAMETRCKEEAYNEVLAILDSMQEEPVCEELGKAAVEAFKQIVDSDKNNFLEVFKAGAKWQKERDLGMMSFETTPSKDLEELIDNLSKRYPEVSFAKLSRIAVRVSRWQKEQDQETIELAEDHAMLAGMNKMKEEMMAKAVDATIEEPEPLLWRVLGELEGLFVAENNLHDGDGVKVIIIKE